MSNTISIAGEYRIVAHDADGNVTFDSGNQRNIILNAGIDLLGGPSSADMMSYCLIGSGNTAPNPEQEELEDYVAVHSSVADGESHYNYDAGDALYKVGRSKQYTFTDLNNVQISELGLAASFTSEQSYELCTRALIKDANGNPTTLTVLTGGTLNVFYTLWAVFNTADVSGKVNILDNGGNRTAYDYTLRLAYVGQIDYLNSVGMGFSSSGTSIQHGAYSDDIAAITSSPSAPVYNDSGELIHEAYVPGSGVMSVAWNIPIGVAVGDLRTFSLTTTRGIWQIRFGSELDDSPITKTDTQALIIPIQITWKQYTGSL